jgi:predicted alpha-1,2-mannosidase
MNRQDLLVSCTHAVALSAGIAAVAPVPAAAQSAVADPAAAVNPLIGTNRGETFPGADTPFGMVQWSPENTAGNQTRTVRPGGYGFNTTRIRGFALTHLSGTGCAGASGDVPFMPFPGTVTTSPTADNTDARYASNFSHANETATAGFYRVGLDSGVNVELTATTRTGSGRFTYPAGQPATMLIRTSNSELGSSAAQTTINAAARTITGSVTSGNFCGNINAETRRSYYQLFFVAVFDRPFASTGTWVDANVTQGSVTSSGGTTFGNGFPPAGRGSGGFVTFPAATTVVNVRVGISYVSLANAQANLEAENPSGTTFDTVRQRAHDAWNTVLNRIEITGGSAAQQTVFYTALYHALLHANVFSDVDGRYMGMDQAVHTVTGSQRAQYANFSGWDIYRGQVQLVTLLQPDVGSDMAQSLFNQANQNGGVWDRWTHNQGGTHVMTGDPSHASLPSIFAFGGTDFDSAGALASMLHSATTVTAADRSRVGWNVMVIGERPSLDQYLALGYVPADGNAWGGAGETLEDGNADFALSQLASRLGNTSAHDQFLARAQGWRKVFNPANGGFISERNADGTFRTPNPASSAGFAEGSSAQYTWMIPYNPRGLFAAMGGNSAAIARLDDFFHDAAGNFSLSGGGGLKSDLTNEPSIGTPWLYNFARQPWKTQATVRQVLNTLWTTAPNGIPGQDDLGAMSAWYVWSAMGLQPIAPGRSELLLAAPLFSQVIIHRGNGVNLTINAAGAATNAGFIQSLTVNGTTSTKSWLPESIVSAGGTVNFTLGTTANTSWGTAADDVPPSFDVGSVPPGTTNLALNKPATASASCNANEGPQKANNGSVSGGNSDKWCGTGATKTWRVDLGAGTVIRSVTVRHAQAGGESATFNTRDFDLQTSNDGVTFTTVAQVRGNTAASTTTLVLSTTRFLRLNVITAEQAGNNAARIYEVEVFQ